MRITKEVTISSQVGTVEADSDRNVSVRLTGIRGNVTLAELEGLLREARDLDRRLNPVIVKAKKRRSR